jgi:TolB protein
MRFLISLFLAQAVSPVVISYVCVYDLETRQERVVARLEADGRWEAPNWTPDGKWLVVNSRGLLYRLSPEGGVPEKIDTGAINKVNNDHGVSPDGKSLVISAGQMYVLPFAGGEPRQVTQLTPSYYHGWSPDGKTLAYCAKRGDNFDVYGISVEGGEEKRLTSHVGYDDGPEYTPDGKWIWFNSDRAGTWDLWRMPAGGAGDGDMLAQRMTQDEREDWFAHWSPNGKRMVFLSFAPGTKGHPANQTVQLRLWKGGGKSELLKEFFGGQGTINVNSWAPDSRRFAYVRYELR